VVELCTYQPSHLPGLVEIWNQSLRGEPNFVNLDQEDLRGRVIAQPWFNPSRLLVAAQRDRLLGFVHFGPRLNSWSSPRAPRREPAEGHIYVLVAPRSERSLARDLLAAAGDRLAAAGARHLLLGPSWLYGTQPFYNGIAGAYEFPGLSVGRQELLAVAGEAGFAPVAEYGTPVLDLSPRDHIAALQTEGAHLWRRAQAWGLQRHRRPAAAPCFPDRDLVELVLGREVVAMTAYGPWPEYAREYGRRLFGLTSVQVSPAWRGRGLGKLIVILAMEAAIEAGAEALHLHVWRDNQVAWNLYHRAIGFRPEFTWLTLARQVN